MKRHRLGLIGALALVLSGSLTYVVMQTSVVLTEVSLRQTLDDGGLADLSIVTYGTSPAMLDTVREFSGVAAADARYDTSGLVETPGGDTLSGDFFGINASQLPDVYRLTLMEGSFLNPQDNLTVLAEWHFSRAQGVQIDDVLILEVFEQQVEVRVVGIVSTIEYMFPATNTRQLIPQRGSSAPLFLNMDLISAMAGQEGMINEVSVIFDEGTDYGMMVDNVLTLFEDESIYRVFRGAELVESMEGLAEMEMGKDMTPVMAILLLASSTAVIYVVVRRVIEDQRQSIGVMMSLGYSPQMIQLGYIIVFVGITLLGSIIATLIATPITVWLTAWSFAEWNMAVVWGPVTSDVFVWGFLSGPITALFAAVFPVRSISKLEPIRVIRGLDFELKPIGMTLLEKMADAVSSVSYLFRYSARSMSRSKMRTLMLCFGIAMVSFTSMNTILYIDSIYVSVDVHMDSHSDWDLVLDMRSPVASAQLESLIQDAGGVTTYSRFLKVSYFSELGDIGQPFEVLFLEFDSGQQTVDVVEGRDTLTSDECVVETRIATRQNLEIGHIIEMSIDNSTESFTVVGICESIFMAVFLDYEAAPRVDDEPLITGAFLSVDPQSNRDDISSTLSESVLVESVQSYQEAVSGVKGLFVLIEVIMYFLIVMCVAIVFLVVWTTVNISTLERIPEFSQLEAIGFDQGNLKRILYGEVLLISILGTIISVPPAIYFGYVLLPLMYQTLSVMDFFVRPIPLLVSFVIPIVAAVLSAAHPARVLGRVDLPSILRDRNPQ